MLSGGLVKQTAQRIIRMLAARIAQHNQRIEQLEIEIATLLDEHGNPVAQLVGAGPIVAAKLIAHAGDPSRFRSPAAFAAYSETAPITCGSGKTNGRHRLNQAANRQLNAAIHRIALTQARCHPQAWNSPDFAESFALAAKAAERMVCNAEDKARVFRAVSA